MQENKYYGVWHTADTVRKRIRAFFTDVLAGICIGTAFIIPGFSGGSVAAILGATFVDTETGEILGGDDYDNTQS